MKRYLLFILSFLTLFNFYVRPVNAAEISVPFNEPQLDSNSFYFVVLSNSGSWDFYFVNVVSADAAGVDVIKDPYFNVVLNVSNGYLRFGIASLGSYVVTSYSIHRYQSSTNRWSLFKEGSTAKDSVYTYTNVISSSSISSLAFGGAWFGLPTGINSNLSIIWGNETFVINLLKDSLSDINDSLSVITDSINNFINVVKGQFYGYELYYRVKDASLNLDDIYNSYQLSSGDTFSVIIVPKDDFNYDLLSYITVYNYTWPQSLSISSSRCRIFYSTGHPIDEPSIVFRQIGYFYATTNEIDLDYPVLMIRFDFTYSGSSTLNFKPANLQFQIQQKSYISKLDDIISGIVGSVDTPGVSDNDKANASLGGTINDYDSIENDTTSNLTNSMANISTDINLFKNTDFVTTGSWVASQLQNIYQNDIMGLISTFSLVIGLALALIGFRINNK